MYCHNDLQDNEKRKKIENELNGKLLRGKICNFNNIFGFIHHTDFIDNIFFYTPDLNIDTSELRNGDYLEFYVAIAPKQGTNFFTFQVDSKKPVNLEYISWTDVHSKCRALSSLLARLGNSAELCKVCEGQRTFTQLCEKRGLKLENLKEWIPDVDHITALRHLSGYIGCLSNPNTDHLNILLKVKKTAQTLPPSQRKKILSLVPSLTKLQSNSSFTTTHKNKSKQTNSPPKADFKNFPIPLKEIKEKRPPISVRKLSNWGNASTSISLYIDEKWDINTQLTDGQHFIGTLSAIAWADEYPNSSLLPQIPLPTSGHVHNLDSASAYLRKLLACKSALPIVLPIFSDTSSKQQYDKIIYLALQLILGWILPRPLSTKKVHIYLEHYGTYGDGQQKTEYLDGLLQGLQPLNPTRFSNWNIVLAEWCPKDYGYIPYADILAYCTGSGLNAYSLNNEFMIDKLPGYVPFKRELVPTLVRLESVENTGHVADILDLARDLSGTSFLKVLTQDLKQRLSGRTDLYQRLYEELDCRYREKGRDLEELRSQHRLVVELAGEIPADAPLTLLLMETAVRLQAANHEGDPIRYSETVNRYVQVCDRARDNGLHELVTHCELNRAVRQADLMLPGEALAIVEDMKDQQYLSLLTRGKVWSSRGQYLSMQGNHEDADAAFGQALEYIARADLAEDKREKNLDQTRVYRALNALDGDLDDVEKMILDVLEDWNESALRFATAPPNFHPFHHHLLVRSIFLFDDMETVRDIYLGELKNWSHGIDHPWELIELYRGLLLWETESKTESPGFEHFKKSILISTEKNHGVTLKLIAAMISVVTCCCYEHKDTKEKAQIWINEIYKSLPGAAPALDTLRTILNKPNTSGIMKALEVLPFNYH